MKKVLLLLSISAFTSASAQQKDVFDIQKHLEKGFLEKKKIPGTLFGPLGKSNHIFNFPFEPQSWKMSHILSNGDMVYLLPQDNMPCVVPATTQFIMPNVSISENFAESNRIKQTMPGIIPNAGIPYKRFIPK
jgi:hypothetical protein